MLRGELEPYGLEQRYALIRFHFHVEPGSIEEYARLWKELEFCLHFTDKMRTTEIKKG